MQRGEIVLRLVFAKDMTYYASSRYLDIIEYLLKWTDSLISDYGRSGTDAEGNRT